MLGRIAAELREKRHIRVSSEREGDNDNNCIVGSERDVRYTYIQESIILKRECQWNRKRG